MRNVIYYIAGRWFEARAQKAMRRYLALKSRAEVFFTRVGIEK